MRQRPFQKKPQRRAVFVSAPGLILGIAAVGAAGYLSAGDLISSVAATAQGCDIKGNISINSRECFLRAPIL
jgi:hypothetical protein